MNNSNQNTRMVKTVVEAKIIFSNRQAVCSTGLSPIERRADFAYSLAKNVIWDAATVYRSLSLEASKHIGEISAAISRALRPRNRSTEVWAYRAFTLAVFQTVEGSGTYINLHLQYETQHHKTRIKRDRRVS